MLWGGFALQAVAGWSATLDTTPRQFWTWLGSQFLLAATIAWWWHRQATLRHELQVQLDTAAARQLRFAADQARFVDHLAHEIKTPLTVVVNRAEILQRCSADASAVRTHAKELADYALNYSHLVDAFLRLTGPAPVPDARRHARVHVYDLILEAVHRLQANARSRGVGITVTFADPANERDTPANAAVEVLGDERLLLAMLDSLLRHAVRNAPRNTLVTIQVDAPHDLVIVHTRSSARVPSPTASDTVLDAYLTAGDPEPRPTGETAFAICRRIASHHGGKLRLPSAPVTGFEFVVTLPRWRPEASMPATSVATAPSTTQDASPPAEEPQSAEGTR